MPSHIEETPKEQMLLLLGIITFEIVLFKPYKFTVCTLNVVFVHYWTNE